MAIFSKEEPILGTTIIKSSKSSDKPLIIRSAENVEIASFNDAGVFSATSSRVVVQDSLAVGDVDKWMFIADRAYEVKSAKVVYSVAGGSAAAVRPRKVTDTSAPGAVASGTVKELTTANFDLTAAANTNQTGTLSATVADLRFAAGDKLGLDFSGTLTALAGGVITIELQAI